jgi:energy-coupling factor transporter ATP-binding protein EcfA2
MRIKREGLVDFSSYNANYNSAISPVVGDIFNTELSQPEQYISSRVNTVALPGRLESQSIHGDHVRKEYAAPPQQVGRFDTTRLGEYERVLLSCLAWGKYSTYVLVGEMGSGKTTTVKYMKQVLENPRLRSCGACTSCEPTIIYRDFNEPSSGSVLRHFRSRLRFAFKAEMRHIFRTETRLIDKFTNFIRESANRITYSYFDDFLEDEVEKEPAWSKLAHAQKISKLFKYIDNFGEGDDSSRLELLMLLTSFIRKSHRPDQACLVLILDNLDSVAPSSQFDLLVEILKFQEMAKIHALVPLRRSTFEQLPSHSALSFGIISHRGPWVSDVVRSRISISLRDWDKFPQAQALDPKHQIALKKRLEFISQDLSSMTSGSEKVLWLAGASLRQGLFMFERVLVNNSVAYDKDPQNRDEVLRCAIQGIDSEFDSSGRFVANVFADAETNELSLLNLRILQFIGAFGEHPNQRKTRNLFSALGAISPQWKSDTIRKSLNYLLHSKRPLLWVDGKTRYESTKHAVECDDILYMTEAGDNFLRHLIFDIQYLQEMLSALEWREDSGLPLSVKYGSMHERFELLRRFLEIIIKHDREETLKFDSLRSKNVLMGNIRVGYISQKMSFKIGESILAIYRSVPYRSRDIADILRSWSSTMITAFNLQSGVAEAKWKSLIRNFARLISEFDGIKKV